MQTPVSCKKRNRFTLNNHTVKTVIINKNIITNKNAVSILWYLFTFSAAAFSLATSLSSFFDSAIAKISTRSVHNFTKTDVLYAAILMRRPVTGLGPGYHGQCSLAGQWEGLFFHGRKPASGSTFVSLGETFRREGQNEQITRAMLKFGLIAGWSQACRGRER